MTLVITFSVKIAVDFTLHNKGEFLFRTHFPIGKNWENSRTRLNHNTRFANDQNPSLSLCVYFFSVGTFFLSPKILPLVYMFFHIGAYVRVLSTHFLLSHQQCQRKEIGCRLQRIHCEYLIFFFFYIYQKCIFIISLK